MSNKKPENGRGRHLAVGVGEAGRTDVMCGTVADNCPVNIYVAVCGRGRRAPAPVASVQEKDGTYRFF